jgi:aspartokinase
MKVMKFGGTSVANADRITELRHIVAERLQTTPRE